MMATPGLTKLLPWAALLVMGALWGLSFSLARIVVAAGIRCRCTALSHLIGNSRASPSGSRLSAA